MTTTRLQRRRLVCSVQLAVRYLDELSKSAITDEEVDRFYAIDDDMNIGSENRKQLAAILRKCRKRSIFRREFRAYARDIAQHQARNPRRFGHPKPYPRYYPHEVTRKGSPAKTHRDCAYCGTGLGQSICGVCKQAGIDGPVIRGTEARKGTTYIEWRKK